MKKTGKIITLKIDDDDYKLLKQAAKKERLTMSALIRQIVFKTLTQEGEK